MTGIMKKSVLFSFCLASAGGLLACSAEPLDPAAYEDEPAGDEVAGDEVAAGDDRATDEATELLGTASAAITADAGADGGADGGR